MNQDLLDACAAVPNRVICLVSALAYHNLRTPIPTATGVATDRNA
ncbi:hypothetical protein [Holophaga foetida]|nr:hypothetical protein [Holophaga foetida]